MNELNDILGPEDICFVTGNIIDKNENCRLTDEFDAWISERGQEIVEADARGPAPDPESLIIYGEWYAKDAAADANEANDNWRAYYNMQVIHMRAFSTLELLVVVALISLMISMTLFFRWDDTKKELEDSQDIQQATTELWLLRIEDPSQPVYWVWEDENGTMWMLSRSDNKIRKVGP